MSVGALEHVLVLTDDLEGTRAFYCEALGLAVGERPPLEFSGYWLYGDGTPCLHLADRGEYLAHAATLGLSATGAAGGGGPIDHVAFTAPDYEAIDARLRRHGLAPVTNTVAGGRIRQLFVHDPNGVRVEVNVSAGAEVGAGRPG